MLVADREQVARDRWLPSQPSSRTLSLHAYSGHTAVMGAFTRKDACAVPAARGCAILANEAAGRAHCRKSTNERPRLAVVGRGYRVGRAGRTRGLAGNPPARASTSAERPYSTRSATAPRSMILMACWHMLSTGELYTTRRLLRKTRSRPHHQRLIARLESLGHKDRSRRTTVGRLTQELLKAVGFLVSAT
jgi:hypothetical protein